MGELSKKELSINVLSFSRRAYTLPPAMALCRKRRRPQENVFVRRDIKESAENTQILVGTCHSKIEGHVMEVIRQNQNIRNMRCHFGNAKNRLTHWPPAGRATRFANRV